MPLRLQWPRVESLVLAGIFLVLGGLVVVPLAVIVLQSIFPRLDRGSLEAPFSKWVQLVTEPAIGEVVITTIQLGLLVSLLTSILGIVLGYLVARTDLPWKNGWDILLTIPFLTPPFIGAFSWILLAQPRGYVEQILGTPAPWLQGFILSFWGVVFVMTMHLFPFCYLAASRAFVAVGQNREYVARTLGAGPLRTFFRVTLPLGLPGILAGALLAFVMAIEEFGTAAILGRRARVFLLSGEIERYTTSVPIDRGLAATMAMVLIALALSFFLVQAWILARRSYVTVTGREGRPEPVQLGWWRFPAFGLLGTVVFFSLVMPWGGVLLTSLLRTQGGGLAAGNFTLQQYATLLADPAARGALGTSVSLAAVAATLTVLLGALVGYLIYRTTVPGRRAVDGLVALPNVLPGIVIAVAILIAWNVAQVPLPIYRSPAIMIAGFVAIFIPIAARLINAGFIQSGSGPEDVARVLGGGWAWRFRKIVLPMLAPSLIAAWMLVFIIASRELVASLILRPPGVTTASVYIFQSFEQGNPLLGMAMAAVMMGTTVVGLLILQRVARVQIA